MSGIRKGLESAKHECRNLCQLCYLIKGSGTGSKFLLKRMRSTELPAITLYNSSGRP